MTGSHQLWRLDVGQKRVERFAGSGGEALTDGALRAANLAQPTGLALDGDTLYFADSESSAIRVVSLAEGRVETVVGTGLLDFGDVDGSGSAVRLQHPYGVAHVGGRVYVADTYNNKVKVVDPATRSSSTLFGEEEAGLQDGKAPLFDEPQGVATDGERLYIADTNNHRVCVADLRAGEVTTLDIAGL